MQVECGSKDSDNRFFDFSKKIQNLHLNLSSTLPRKNSYEELKIIHITVYGFMFVEKLLKHEQRICALLTSVH